MEIGGKAVFFLGLQPDRVDIHLLHPSISRVHAALITDADTNFALIDLGSKYGTKVNGKMIFDHTPVTLKDKDVATFGESSRSYKFKIDYSKVKRMFESERLTLEEDLKKLEKLDDENLDIDTLKNSLGLKKHDTIFIGGLVPASTESDVRGLFEEYGKIESIRVPIDSQT